VEVINFKNMKYRKGQKVYWRDPAGETSGVYEVCDNKRSDIIFISNGVSEAEVYPCELYPLSQKVIFRRGITVPGITALFPDQILEENPRLVASYDSHDGLGELDFEYIMELTSPAYTPECSGIIAELKDAGYDQLEIIAEEMTVYKLLDKMGEIARNLITSRHITDFTNHDTKSILDSNAKTPFIWQVRDTGTWLYFLNESDWKKRLLDRIESYKFLNHENLYFLYDGEKFCPIFLKTILEMASKEF
jgi:hypothetical protein